MSGSHHGLKRERRTIRAMIDVFCRGVHDRRGGACAECGDLLAYAEKRLEKCPFQDDKPPCAKCPIHCYQPARRDQIKTVMRYSGPRMFWRHPWFALRHWLDGFKQVPPHPKNAARQRSGSGPGGSRP
jgi:hypothetical protein